MQRGKNQVLFKYLPGKPIDYGNGIALVERWYGRPVSDVNKSRIISEVYKAIHTFDSTRGYPTVANPNSFELLSPVFIEAELFPLTFVCETCSRAYSFNSVQQLNRVLRGHKCFCGGNLRQFDLVYTHECGNLWGPKTAPCKEHGFDNIKLNTHGSNSPQNWRWECGICNKTTASLDNRCQACSTGPVVYLKPFRQTSVFMPHSLTLVNLHNLDEDRLSEDDIFQRLILAKYLDLYPIYETNFEECCKVSPKEDSKLDQLIIELRSKKMDQDTIDKVLASMNKINPSRKDVRDKIIEHVNRLIQPVDGNVFSCAIRGYEFMETLEGSSSVHLSRIVQSAVQRAHPNLEKISKFPSEMKRIGITNAYVLNDLSILKIVYGYTRGALDNPDKTLNRFVSDKSTEQGKVPIYMNRSDTEAILLEFDRWKILRWLQENGLALKIPNRDDESQLKAWFLNNIENDKVSTFQEIETNAPFTKMVYKLIHTISHALLITGSVECGLDKNSLAEIILPSIPAIIIYTSSVQELQTGGMFTLFENNIYPWIDKTINKVSSCIYDPVCMDHKASCHACLQLSEFSCCHFNYDLGRDVLIGKTSNTEKTVGFWSKDFLKKLNG